QLKNEINRISAATKFNTIPVFNNPTPDKMVALSVEGAPSDLSVYNATFDPATGKITSGGILFHGERFSWDTIDPEHEIAYVDTDGIQKFHGGTWIYTTQTDAGHKGTHFQISCVEGAETPYITRDIDFEADAERGFAIDGEWHPWSDLKNDFGASMSEANVSPGFWSFDYYGAEVTFEFLDVSSLADAAEAVNKMHDDKFDYGWHPKTGGTATGQAAETRGLSGVEISGKTIDTVLAGKSFTIKADKTEGLSLLDGNGSEIPGSKRSWSELGLDDWMNGRDVQPKETLYYTYSESDSSPNYFEFQFSLSDVTSQDAVVAALDGISVGADSFQAKTDLTAKLQSTGKVTVVSSGFNRKLSVSDEYNMGRNFDTASSTYDTKNASASGLTMSVTMQGGLTLSSSYDGNNGYTYADVFKIADTAAAYVKRIVEQTRALATSNLNYNVAIDSDSASNETFYVDLIRTAGDKQAKISNTYSYDYSAYKSLVNGKIGVSMETTNSGEFMNIGGNYQTTGSVQFYKLDYDTVHPDESLMVADSLNGTYWKNPASNQYEVYHAPSAFYEKLSEDNYRLIDNPDSFPGTKYYKDAFGAYQDYSTYTPPQLYKTEPLNADGTAKAAALSAFSGTGPHGSGVQYYNDGTGKYRQYDPANTYRLKFTNLYDGSEIVRDRNGYLAVGNRLAQDILSDLAAATTIEAKSYDYSRMTTRPGIKAANATRPVFESVVEKTPIIDIFDGVNIQHSNTLNDRTWIPRYGMNSFALGISNADCRTAKGALRTIDLVAEADNIVSKRRAMYGALQNRYEHAIKINENSSENLTAAESRIRDADMATLTVQLSIQSILEQAGQSMLSNANNQPQQLLALLS
nr:hypothetical protein [Lachnospiraceae bacterium]